MSTEQNNGKTRIPNEIAQDRSISYEAKGVLGYLLSLGHDELDETDIMNTGNIGRDKCKRIIKELIDAGYVQERKRFNDPYTGQIIYSTLQLTDKAEPYRRKRPELLQSINGVEWVSTALQNSVLDMLRNIDPIQLLASSGQHTRDLASEHKTSVDERRKKAKDVMKTQHVRTPPRPRPAQLPKEPKPQFKINPVSRDADLTLPTPKEPTRPRRIYENRGYVYLVQAVMPDTYYKIGKSKVPHKRIETFGVKLPFPIDVICLIKTNDRHTLELVLHQRFADKRVNGEWFELTDEDVAYIKALAEASHE